MNDRPVFDDAVAAGDLARTSAPVAPPDLRQFLLDAGVAPDEVVSADADGTLELLALEHLVDTDAPRWTIEEASERTGVTVDDIRAYWRALGYPDPRTGEKLFGAVDIEILGWVSRFMVEGALDRDVALQMSRVIGSALERIASAQVDTLESGRAAGPVTDAAEGDVDVELAMRRGAELFGLMPTLLEYVWRRHVSAAARRRRLRASAGEGTGVCVGFADMVGFTAQTQQLDEEELAEVVARFESIAYDTVAAHGGRVVKMIGDEVMFLCDSVRAGAELALALAETFAEDEALSDVRVGLASGPVLEREGDAYGPVVNLASRIVSIAYPGAVVVSEDVHDALADDEAFRFRTIRQHFLKDIGRVRLWTLRRPDDVADERYQRARDRRAARREFLLETRAHRFAERVRRGEDLPEGLGEDVAVAVAADAPTEEFEAITDAVLGADIDDELQIELLADIEAARRLAELEAEAERRANEADLEAEGRLEEIETEARRKVSQIETEARRRVEQALAEAEEKAGRVNEEAERKVRRVAEETERKAEQAEKEARREAKRKAEKRKRQREREGTDGTDGRKKRRGG